MERNFGRYRAVGHRVVTGFLQSEVLLILDALNSVQRAKQVSGAVAEIGVHHGKLFIGLRLLQRAGEKSVAIDIFGDQELNVDGSGHGNLEKFVNNVTLWSSMDDVVVHQGDSTKLEPQTLRDLAGGDIRFFSVDGGHTEEIVFSDMKLAEATLADGGIVIADDVFNQQWPGVAVGTLRYLEDGSGIAGPAGGSGIAGPAGGSGIAGPAGGSGIAGPAGGTKLAPFLIGFNKVFFAQPDYCELYRSAVESAVAGRLRLATGSSVLAGHDVGLVVPQGAVDIVRRSETARSLYHRAYREMVRGLQAISGRAGSGR